MVPPDKGLTLESIRQAIDDADDIILRAIATRMQAVKHLRDIKAAEGRAITDPSREDELRSKWRQKAIASGIRPELALLILDFLLEESKRIQQAS